jgi:hypothetical protein
MSLIADIFITTKDRPELLRDTLRALKENTNEKDFRLTIVFDGVFVPEDMKSVAYVVDVVGLQMPHMLVHPENMGLGPSINQALSHIQALNQWFEHPTHGDPSKVAPFVCYIQDDILVSKDWLPKMAKFFMLLEKPYNLGFASGIECIEHPVRYELNGGMQLKNWIRAANMFGRREYWMSMYPIPRFDPETGRVRAKPNDGMGSGVDWWFVRNHENSVCRTGRTNLVFPGMMVHAGYDQSTWLKRELPESDSDKEIVKRNRDG